MYNTMRRKYVSIVVPRSRLLYFDEPDPHYSWKKYNRIYYTNNTVKKPYYCPKSRKKCKMCSNHKKSFSYKNKILKKDRR